MSAADATPPPRRSPDRRACRPRGPKGCRRKCEWGQSDAVDQTEHDERQAERAHAGGATGRAPDDRDPQKVGEPPRRTTPRIEAPAFAATSASGCGRSPTAKSRRQAMILSA